MVYLTLIFLLIGIIRALMIIKPFLIKLEEKEEIVATKNNEIYIRKKSSYDILCRM